MYLLRSKIVSYLLIWGLDSDGWNSNSVSPMSLLAWLAWASIKHGGLRIVSFYTVTSFSKPIRKKQKSEVAGFIGIKPRSWPSMTFAILYRPYESQSLSRFTTSSLDALWTSPLLLISHHATEKLFALNYTVSDDNDNASILFSFLDLQRASNWILFEPHNKTLRQAEQVVPSWF